MKALQLQSIGRLEMVDIPIPSITDNQLLVRTGAAVICTSDLNDIRANPFGIELPVIMGHEGAGTVEAVGTGVRGFRKGDRVATHPVHPCGTCANCRASMGHLCSDMGHLGLNMSGTFAGVCVVRQDRARVVPPGMPHPVAALAEPVCVCLEALAQARLRPGQGLLVIGDGPFGVMIARAAQGLQLGRLVIAGRHDFRLAFAGAAIRVNTAKAKDPVAAMRAECAGGYDAVILAVGTAEAVREGCSLLRPKGRLVVFSAIPGETPVNLMDVHIKELEIVGACNDDNRLDEAVARLEDASLDLGRLVTHTFPFERFREAFNLAGHGKEKAMKVALTFELT